MATAEHVAELQVPVQLEGFVLSYRAILCRPELHDLFSMHVSHLMRATLIAPWHAIHCMQLVKHGAFCLPEDVAAPAADAPVPAAALPNALLHAPQAVVEVGGAQPS
jgi:hypothetical protein